MCISPTCAIRYVRETKWRENNCETVGSINRIGTTVRNGDMGMWQAVIRVTNTGCCTTSLHLAAYVYCACDYCYFSACLCRETT